MLMVCFAPPRVVINGNMRIGAKMAMLGNALKEAVGGIRGNAGAMLMPCCMDEVNRTDSSVRLTFVVSCTDT